MPNKETSPLLSVVVPCYNIGQKAGFLRECLHSLLLQTYSHHLDVILVNDGSQDDTQDVIEEAVSSFTEKGLSVRALALEENLGVSEARNAGIRAARGKYVGFLDYDDLWLEHFALQAVEVMESRSQIKVVLGGTILYRQFGRKEKAHLIPIPENINEIPWGDFCAFHLINNFRVGMGSAVICRRDLFEEYPQLWMDQFLSKRSAEDVFFGFKMLSLRVRAFYLRQPCIIHRGVIGEMSRSKEAVWRLNQKDIQDYIWLHAGSKVREMVLEGTPSCLPLVDARVAKLNQEFGIREIQGTVQNIGYFCRYPNTFKIWVRNGLMRSESTVIHSILWWRSWHKFVCHEHDLQVAKGCICAARRHASSSIMNNG
jgi:glycosyltransferase involved in cell wall biosynthesis